MVPTDTGQRPGDLGVLMRHIVVALAGLAAASVARRRVREVLDGEVSDDQLDGALLVASELVGNAVRHVGGPVTLTVDLFPCAVLVVVADTGADIDAVPLIRSAAELALAAGTGSEEEGGRGIALVAAVSSSYWVEPTMEGKNVVALFRTAGAPC
ncbi:ATP-binding protein [Streptomyces sp. NPDC020875]|uniref:ATP-binding protein n=1 Tax=Streptomyces sp. NPDC020875 TaxID=3154898 RepID=UPI0033ECC4D1